MTGNDLRYVRQRLGLSQASVAANCGGTIASGAFTATDIATAEAAGNGTISNSILNAAAERSFRPHLNDIPQANE